MGDEWLPHLSFLRHVLLHSQKVHILHHTLAPLFSRPFHQLAVKKSKFQLFSSRYVMQYYVSGTLTRRNPRFITPSSIDIGFITESWQRGHIPDSVVSIPNYIIFRKDRTNKEQGGVCICVRGHIKYEISGSLLCCDQHEILWLTETS